MKDKSGNTAMATTATATDGRSNNNGIPANGSLLEGKHSGNSFLDLLQEAYERQYTKGWRARLLGLDLKCHPNAMAMEQYIQDLEVACHSSTIQLRRQQQQQQQPQPLVYGNGNEKHISGAPHFCSIRFLNWSWGVSEGYNREIRRRQKMDGGKSTVPRFRNYPLANAARGDPITNDTTTTTTTRIKNVSDDDESIEQPTKRAKAGYSSGTSNSGSSAPFDHVKLRTTLMCKQVRGLEKPPSSYPYGSQKAQLKPGGYHHRHGPNGLTIHTGDARRRGAAMRYPMSLESTTLRWRKSVSFFPDFLSNNTPFDPPCSGGPGCPHVPGGRYRHPGARCPNVQKGGREGRPKQLRAKNNNKPSSLHRRELPVSASTSQEVAVAASPPSPSSSRHRCS